MNPLLPDATPSGTARRGFLAVTARVLHTLGGVHDPFDFQALRIQQPRKLLPNRASYEILSEQRQLLAIATETEAHTRLKLLSKSMPDARVLAVTTAAGR